MDNSEGNNKSWIYTLDETLCMGPMPLSARDYSTLWDRDVRSVLCLQEPHEYNLEEKTEFSARGGVVLHCPIPDMTVPSLLYMTEILGNLHTLQASATANGTCVYIHCLAGRGRTGTVLACALVTEGYAAARAIEIVSKARKRDVPETQAQKDFVVEFETAFKLTLK